MDSRTWELVLEGDERAGFEGFERDEGYFPRSARSLVVSGGGGTRAVGGRGWF